MFGSLRRSRRPSASSAMSSSSSDDHHNNSAHSSPAYSRRQSSACHSERSCEGLTMDRTQQLWRCMLELQGRYGCYHCTRMDLAMEAGDEGVNYMPNRFIIDTLNDSVVDLLPEEGWTLLDRCLHPEDDESMKN